MLLFSLVFLLSSLFSLVSQALECTSEGCEKVSMEYRFLGPSGLLVSALSYGNMITFEQEGVEGSLEIVKYLVDNGVNFFDTAEVYSKGIAETILGEVLQKGIEKKYWERTDLVISTKIYWGKTPTDVLAFPNKVGLSRKHIIEGLDASLARLGLSYVDVVFCHRPDVETPLEETVRAMDWLINQGKAFYWGTSEWSADQIRHAHQIADRLGLIHPIVEQPEYSLLVRDRFEKEYLPLYADPGLGTTVWGALASGVLSGKYNSGIPEDSRFALFEWWHTLAKGRGLDSMLETSRKLQVVADELGCSLAQLSLAWVLKNSNVSTIIMGGKLKYLKENLDSLKVVPKLTLEVMAKIETIVDNKPKPEFDWRSRN